MCKQGNNSSNDYYKVYFFNSGWGNILIVLMKCLIAEKNIFSDSLHSMTMLKV